MMRFLKYALPVVALLAIGWFALDAPPSPLALAAREAIAALRGGDR